MNKVIIIGCPGSGKSTFARKLAEKTGLPLHYLDMMYWNADKSTVSREIFDQKLCEVLEQDKWIADGNYGRTMEMRLKGCDTVFFLDFDVDTCLQGIKERKGKPRPDMPWIETEDDEEFLEFIKNYTTQSRPKVIELLEKYNDKNIIIFKTRDEADDYITTK